MVEVNQYEKKKTFEGKGEIARNKQFLVFSQWIFFFINHYSSNF